MSDPDDFGAVIREFRPRRWEVGFVVFGVMTAVAIFVLVSVQPLDKKSPAMGPVAVGVAVCGMLAALCGLMGLFSLGQRVVIHENGLSVQTLRATQRVPWGDVEAVYHHLFKVFLGQEVWLVTRGGEKVQLPQLVVGLFAAYREICDRIKDRLLAEVRREIASGRMVSFGDDLGVSRGEFHWRDLSLPLADVKKLHWGVEHYASGNRMALRSVFSVLEPAGYERLQTKSIPNLPILLELLEKDYHVEVERSTSFFK